MPASRRNPRGFTLVELLIVVVILGILAAVVIPQFSSVQSETSESALVGNLATIRRAIEVYTVNHDDTPPTNITVQLLTKTNADGTPGTRYGPYMRTNWPQNPINHSSAVKTVASMPAAPSGTEGWVYDTTTGEFRANVSGTGPSGNDYFDL